ncbi:uncharacterized protein LOC126926557 isoform X2 [Bombus affinis]|uniref:Uncharacterized protein LOC100642944 isoform X2 n=1 Tax=Bombus terrestris TaxID=30195 RepID=A0A9C6SQB5_BOMTE|nr:uncharacterized protein LOC100642944 isoform X2 [Bombus terrestris]XP_050598885.1 uncharacterized protein LOC126926557 isoform X2 [Bombus affinis]
MNLPRILIISTEKGKANEIAANIGGEKLSNQDHFEYHLWDIQNKYYKTQVLICVTENPSEDISIDDVEALIVHHNPQAEDADQNLKKWSSLIASLAEAEVLLFSCNFITDTIIRNKGKPLNVGEQNPDMDEVEEQFENIELSQDSTETLPIENMLDGIMGEENVDFGELFSQLRAMKEHAALLPTNQRRIAAEQLVTAFWKAMGGDPSEMED